MRAEDWVARLRAADVNAEDRAAFEAWLAADGSHREDYARCIRLGAMPEAVRSHHELMGGLDERLAKLRSRAAQPRKAPRYVPLALAASVVLVAVGGIFALNLPSPIDASTYTTAATRHGEQRPIALADGSSVQLNTDSAVAWRMDEKSRRVILERGEAFFDVAKDSARPFVVKAGSSEVRVVGTQFSVRRHGEQIEVVVKEGRVNIVPDSGPLSIVTPNVELTPGNRGRVVATSRDVKVAVVDAERLTAWRTGSLEFDGMTLVEVVAEVNRYTDTPLVIADERIKGQAISGRVRVGDIETVRFILRERFGIESTEDENSVRLVGR